MSTAPQRYAHFPQIVPSEGDASFTMKAFPASGNFTYATIPYCISPPCTVVNGDTLLITGPRMVNKKSDNVGSAFNLYADFIHPAGTCCLCSAPPQCKRSQPLTPRAHGQITSTRTRSSLTLRQRRHLLASHRCVDEHATSFHVCVILCIPV